jgi:hypothetical protein
MPKRKRRKLYKIRKNRRSRITVAEKLKRRGENREYVLNYLLSHPCVDCGQSNIIVLEFDHVRGKKRDTISALLEETLDIVKAEIDKTCVRCCNCHRIKTAKQFNWKHRIALQKAREDAGRELPS